MPKTDVSRETTGTEVVNIANGEIIEAQLDTQGLNTLATDERSILALFEEFGLTADDLIIGDAYPLADKDDLLDVPLALIQWKFGVSQNFGSEYVQIKAVRLDTNQKVGIFDSGVGIYGALNDMTEARIKAGKPAYNGAVIPRGLTKSEYPPLMDGAVMVRPGGTTYYFN